jgi:hypothetical protein
MICKTLQPGGRGWEGRQSPAAGDTRGYYLLVLPYGTTMTAMAKLSVSVPDELLDRARSLHGPASTSSLVQRGLELLTAHVVESVDRPYAHRPPQAAALLDQAQARLVEVARTEYENGYCAGMADVGELNWQFLERAADARFDLLAKLPEWQRSVAPTRYDNGFSPPKWFEVLVKRFGSMIDPIGFDSFNFTPTRPFVRGYGDALRDAWATVEPGEGSPKVITDVERGE